MEMNWKISFSRIVIPGESPLILSPDWNDKRPGYTYVGAGLDQGDCGVSIQQVKIRNHGRVQCFMGAEGQELSGEVGLTVACKFISIGELLSFSFNFEFFFPSNENSGSGRSRIKIHHGSSTQL